MWLVAKRRGTFLIKISEAPLLRNREEAEAWARQFLEANPDRFARGLEAVEACPAKYAPFLLEESRIL